MARRRLAVVLLVPGPWDREIDGVRRALGHAARGRVAPHITLVPPVNVAEEALGDALAVMRSAAHREGPVELVIGPARTFAPVSPVVYLAVAGDVAAVRRLRDGVFVPPLARRVDHAFVPHVTVAEDLPEHATAEAVTLLAHYRVRCRVDRVHLMAERRDHDGVRRWRPLADADLEPVGTWGRGGLQVEVSWSQAVDPVALALLADPPPPVPGGAEGLTATVRDHAQPVAVAHGWRWRQVGRLEVLVVAPERRGEGLGGRLVAAWVDRARAKGVRWVEARDADAEVTELLRSRGFVVGPNGALVRPLGP